MVQVLPGQARREGDGCRRYLPIGIRFDTRADVLAMEIDENCNRTSLLGAAGLGERILNELILELRGDFASHEATRKVQNRESVDDWGRAIGVLVSWGTLSDDTAFKYRKLAKLRHGAVHYRKELNERLREAALEAVCLLQNVVQAVLSPMGGPPRFIPGTPGHSFLSLEAEQDPLVRRFFIPASVLVSPAFEMQPDSNDANTIVVLDDKEYEPSELTDQEFARVLVCRRNAS